MLPSQQFWAAKVVLAQGDSVDLRVFASFELEVCLLSGLTHEIGAMFSLAPRLLRAAKKSEISGDSWLAYGQKPTTRSGM